MPRIRAAIVCLFLSACGGAATVARDEATDTSGGAGGAEAAATGPSISEARAIEIATGTGADAGYDPAVYTVRSARWEESTHVWWVDVEHEPPAPPGGHFAVEVDGQTGTARLIHGE